MYKPVIGLEIHSELNTSSKMFCSCENNPDETRPNVNICVICTAQPGVLPLANKEAIRKVIKAGLALNCKIAEFSKFDRKNYFYPDLPKGYQISQYDIPFCSDGYLDVETSDGRRKIRIKRIHLEEDVGRSQHDKGTDFSLVDFNRAGVPLMELVTEPDITSAKEAGVFARELQLIFQYIGVSEANMQKGEFRVEANISLMKEGADKFGTKVEIKNLNSFRSLEKGIEYEIKRQAEILDKGEKVIQETRGWHDAKEITFSQREKESAHDYRYFPEPDLPTFNISKEEINLITTELPELPSNRRERFKEEYSLDGEKVEIFSQNKALGDFFEKVISELRVQKGEGLAGELKLAVNYLLTDLQGLLAGALVDEAEFLITPENFAEFISIIHELEVSSNIAKIILKEMFETGKDPSNIIEEKGLGKKIEKGELEAVIKEVVAENLKATEDFKNGNQNSLQFLIGKTMARTQGKADPAIVADLLKKALK